MLHFACAQLRRRSGRALALLLAILASTTGFTVLTGSTMTSKLAVVGKVRANYRGAYDIMVRPKGARTEPERQSGRLAGNALSGTFGGITSRQWQRIRQIKGVEVAAPIAMIGTVTNWNPVYVDLTDLVDPALTEQVLRFNLTWHADRDLTRGRVARPYLVYVTKRLLAFPGSASDGDEGTATRVYTDGTTRTVDACHTGVPTVYEIQPDGQAKPLCLTAADTTATANGGGAQVQYLRLRPDGSFESQSDVLSSVKLPGSSPRRLRAAIRVPLALLLAGVDPREEAALVGLDGAVTLGRYLRDPEPALLGSRSTDPRRGNRMPVLLASQLQLDERGVIDAVRVRTDGRPLAGRSTSEVGQLLTNPGIATVAREVSAGQAYREFTSYDPTNTTTANFTNVLLSNVNTAIRSGQPSYSEQPDGSLRAQPRSALPLPERSVAERADCPLSVPWLSRDTALRPLTVACTGYNGITEVVGVYDSARLRRFNDVVQAPLEGYYPPHAVGADETSRRRLGNRPLLPNDNPGNYLAPSPSLLTSIDVLRHLGAPDDLISAVRVRVEGITGFDPASRERVRVVAERIATETGLEVDILLGASPGPQTIDLPAGQFGRPELRIDETWTKMGVGVAIMRAVDRKSFALFLLVLVVCALFITNATGSAVRDRRRELAVLACLGWPRWRLAVPVLVEVGLLGLVAGGLSLAASYPIAALAGIELSWSHTRFAVPVALVLALVAASVPALRAARSHPLDAVRATAVPARGRPRRHRTLVGLAWSNLARVPGRTALAVAALAVAVAALTLLAAIMFVFDGTLVGTALGDAVSIQIRGVDTAAIVATVVLAVFAVADVLYLSTRERAHELAALRAMGWSAAAVGRLMGHEAFAIGVLSALIGVGTGVAGAATLAGTVPAALFWVSTVTAVTGPLLAILAATIPAIALRSPPTTLLAEE